MLTTLDNALFELQKKYISFDVVLTKKRRKNPIFQKNVDIDCNFRDLDKEIRYAFANHKRIYIEAIKHFDIPSFNFFYYKSLFPEKNGLPYDFSEFEGISLHDKKSYATKKVIKGSAIRYANGIDRIYLYNNSFPDWKYLTNDYIFSITMNYDEESFKKEKEKLVVMNISC